MASEGKYFKVVQKERIVPETVLVRPSFVSSLIPFFCYELIHITTHYLCILFTPVYCIFVCDAFHCNCRDYYLLMHHSLVVEVSW